MLRKGFKSQCERRSAELRKRLGLESVSPLSAFDHAVQIGVTLWAANQVNGLSETDLDQLTVKDGDSWSAFTLFQAGRHLVVYNPVQSRHRINSVVMHELSHIMLGHELASAGLTEDGYLMPSNYNQDQEDEANWLGGTLQLPRPALLEIRRLRLTDDEAKHRFLVSAQMLTWRFRMTGVDYQLANSARKRARSL